MELGGVLENIRNKMVDVFSPEKRSQVMRQIRSTNTKPEVLIRSALHRLGYRYRIHDKRYPGKPDIVFPRYKVVIQVRGCFWHSHCCIDGKRPKSRQDYWIPKLEANQRRDRRNDRKLRESGWKVLVVWGCNCESSVRLEKEIQRIVRELEKRNPQKEQP